VPVRPSEGPRLGLEAAVDLDHHESRENDDAPGILPPQLIAHVVSVLGMTPRDIVDGAPVLKQRLEQFTAGLSEGLTVALDPGGQTGSRARVRARAQRERPVAAGEDARSMAEILRRAAGHPGYLAMSVAFFACGFQLMFITAYLPQYLAICGVSPATSASALGLIGLGNAIGSYVFGRLGARHSPKRLLSAIYLLRTAVIAAFLLAPVSPTSVSAFAACMGLLWLGVVPLVSGLIGGMFGMRYFNTLFGLVFLSHQIGSFMGAWLGGLTFDLTGSFHTAWSAMIVIGLCAATLQWFMDDRAEPAEGFLREQAA